jgi:hypothetical protein
MSQSGSAVGGKLVFHGNLNPEDCKGIPIPSAFWVDVLESWYNFVFVEHETVDKQTLWHNSGLKIAKKPLFRKKLAEKGVLFVHQLFQRGRYLTYAEFRDEYDVQFPFTDYLSILHAIPITWTEELKQLDINELDSTLDSGNIISSSRDAYRQLVRRNAQYPEAMVAKWQQMFLLWLID